jgi:flagellar biosynthesis protein
MSTADNSGAPGSRLRAAVLAYDPLADGAPRLVAKGHGDIAERMIALARANGLAVHQDAGLLNFLMRIDLEEQIPAELYIAVAAVLSLVWHADKAAAQARSSGRDAEPESGPTRRGKKS